MPTFEVQGVDGTLYEVDAPDEARAAAAVGMRADLKPGEVGNPAKSPAYKGSILPFSVDNQGRSSLDWSAGIPGMVGSLLGSAKSAAMLPGDVATGQVDPRSDKGLERAVEMATMATPLNPATRIGDKVIPGMARNTVQPVVPTAAELKAAGSAGYDQVRDMGVQYSSDAIAKVSQALRSKLEADGILAELAPISHKVIDRLASPPEGSVITSAGVEAARRSLRRAGKSGVGEERNAAGQIVRGLDEFVEAADPASVVAGPAAAAGEALTAARNNYAAGKRAETLSTREEAAGLRAAAANSGANGDNAIRSRIASLLVNNGGAGVRGFSEAEQAALRGVVEGNAGRNAVRRVGNLLGGGGGLGGTVLGMAGAGGGSMLAGPYGAAAGAALPIIGAGFKAGGTALTRRALGGVDEMVRMRSPLYEERLAGAGAVGAASPAQDAIMRALLAQQAGQMY